MDNKIIELLASQLQDNLGNRITVALANGIIGEVLKAKDKIQGLKNDNSSTTDTNTQE